MNLFSRKMLATAAALALGVSAQAVVQTFSFNFAGGSGSETASKVFTQNGLTVTVTAFSYDAVTSTFTSSNVGWYSPGLGVKYSGDNSHTIDNSGRIDFLKFAFTPLPADVNSLSIGYVETASNGFGDSDFTYWLNNTGALSLVGGSEVAGGSSTATYPINGVSTAQFSYLIVSASVANANLNNSTHLFGGNDGFKISGLNVTTGSSSNIPPPSVPDSGSSVVLLGAALAGMGVIVRRRKIA